MNIVNQILKVNTAARSELQDYLRGPQMTSDKVMVKTKNSLDINWGFGLNILSL